jgi:hypothetical protein
VSHVIKFKNTSDKTLKLVSVGLPDCAPNAEIDVPLALAAPTRRDNGSRGPSAIEKCAPQLVPVDPIIYEAWKQVPDPLPPKSLVVSTQRREADEPAGVKALRDAAQKLASAPKSDAKTPAVPKAGS